jgi:branched-chain amino acid transport system ATP-binding protein
MPISLRSKKAEPVASSDQFAAREITVQFAGLTALEDVDFTLSSGEVVGLIGPNGAGKTTFINVLSGFLRPSRGRVSLEGRDVTGATAFRIARLGVARTFQSVHPFAGLSVLDNVALGAIGVKVGLREARRRAWEIVNLLEIADQAETRADSLPYGHENLVGLARALAMRPRFVLLDEPASGLSEVETDDLVKILAGVRERFGCGVLIVEHDMSVIMRLCDRVQVLDYGRTISEGTVDEVRTDPAVIEAYLGSESARLAQERIGRAEH